MDEDKVRVGMIGAGKSEASFVALKHALREIAAMGAVVIEPIAKFNKEMEEVENRLIRDQLFLKTLENTPDYEAIEKAVMVDYNRQLSEYKEGIVEKRPFVEHCPKRKGRSRMEKQSRWGGKR